MDGKVIYPELSYKIIGVLFEVHSRLGNRYQEKYYQRAVKRALISKNINFKEQVPANITFNGEKIGKYYLDFLVDDKVILELKAVPELRKKDFHQVLGYLKATGLKLGIIANFSKSSLAYKRVLNIY